MASQPYAPRADGSQNPSASLHQTADELRTSAGEMLDEAKQSARTKLNDQKDVAADGIDRFASSLRENARDDVNGARDPFGGVAASAAEGLERLSRSLRDKDVRDMVRDVESFARSQPVAFFGLAVAGGFLAVRFLKASDRPNRSRFDSGREGASSRMSDRYTNDTQEDAWTTR